MMYGCNKMLVKVIYFCLAKQRLHDQFKQNWHDRLENSIRALFYRTISNFRFQPYLEYFTNSKFCQSFVTLRVSSHRLQIEADRWSRPATIPVNERLCNFI
jgi:hypothetical protein